MITKADFEITDFSPDAHMPQISELRVYIRGTSDEVYGIYNEILELYKKRKEMKNGNYI